MTSKADVLIVTVTEVESRAVMNVFKSETGKDSTPEPIGDRIYLDLGAINGARIFMALSGMGSGGVGGSQEGVRKGIEALSPSAVIMVGIAFGINDQKQAVGDILISDRLILYDLQRVGTDEEGNLTVILRGDRPHASPWLFDRLQVANLSRNESSPTVRFGPILSGDKLADNIDFRGQLLEFEPEAIGGEMEGAGLYVACQNSKVDWILVKAICDWADGKKSTDKDARQQLAAKNASTFVLHALRQAPLKLSGEPYPRAEGLSLPRAASETHNPVHSALPPQPSFFGREGELAIVAQAIAPEARTWGALIDGPGGIGKTALAIRAGHLAPATHFDYKILLSAKVRELTPAGERELQDFMLPNYMALLTELARELGEESVGQIDPNERANAVRRALADVRALIVIDNVETFPELERVRLYQFLSRLPTTCKAIVTSRRRADIDARVIRLERLQHKDALDLIDELAKNNRYLQQATKTDRNDLYEITNGNPLLIKWAVGQLGRIGSHCRTMPEALAFLKFAPPSVDNDPLEYIFGDLLDTFTENETAVLAALTHFSEPSTVKWVADVAGISHLAALTALEDLTDRALLVSYEGTNDFLLPPLAASFLRHKRPETVAQTGGRLTDRAYALALENGFGRLERFSVLEAEWPTIAAALPLLMLSESDRLQTLCQALSRFLNFSGRWDEWLLLSQRGEEKALAAGDFYQAGWRASDVGWVYVFREQAAEVVSCASRSAAHWERTSVAGTLEKASTSRLRVEGHRLLGNLPAAIEASQEALSLLQAISLESEDVVQALNSRASVERLQGDKTAAEAGYREALRIARKIDNAYLVAMFTGNLAIMACDREDWVAAEGLAREGLELAGALGHQELIGTYSANLALALIRQDESHDALPYAQRAIDIFTRLRKPDALKNAQAILNACTARLAQADDSRPWSQIYRGDVKG